MARPISRITQTLQDYGQPGSGTGAEKSTWSLWIANLTAANFTAQQGLITDLYTATLDMVLGAQSGSSELAVSSQSAVVVTDPLAQRENKWLVRYHDDDGTKFTVEIPTAKLSLLTLNNEFLDLTGLVAAAYVSAFEAVVKSPDDPTLGVTVDSIQFVGRRN